MRPEGVIYFWTGRGDRAFIGLDNVGAVANDFGQHRQPVTDKTPSIELSEPVNTANNSEAEASDGFSFFKKAQDAEAGETGEDPALVAIEQEMLAVRRLYTGGHVLKDVYVSETRRLYAEAQTIKNGKAE